MRKNLLIIPTLFLSFIANAQWTSQATGFTALSRGIRNVCAVDANIAWVSTYDGSGAVANVQDFSKTTDGGATWIPGTITTANANYSFSNIWAVDANTAWACFFDANANAGGGIYKTSDGGTTWAQQGTGTIFDANSFPDFVYFANASVGIALGDPNGGYFEIYNTIDGGTTWTRVPQANIPAPLSGEYGYANGYQVIGTTVWFITNKGRVFKSIDGGMNWTAAATGLTDANLIAMLNTNEGLVALVPQTGASSISKTSDGGATWTPVTVSSGTFYTSDLAAIRNSTAYVSTGAAQTSSGSSYSVDGGATWINIDNTVQHTAQDWVDGSTGWSGGFSSSATTNGIYKYTGNALGIVALNNNHARMRMFPNPSNGQFTLQIGGAETKDAVVKIVDVVGNSVYEQQLKNNSTVIEKKIDLSTATKGIYFVAVENGTTRFVNKIVIE